MSRLDEHHRAPLLWLLVPYLAGSIAGGFWPDGVDFWIAAGGAVLAGAALLATVRRIESRGRSATVLFATCLWAGAFAAGVVRLHAVLAETPRWRDLPPRAVVLELEVTRVFSRSTAGDRQSCIGRVVAAPALVDDLVGQRVFLSVPLARDAAPDELLRSMRVRVQGVLAPLPPPGRPGTLAGFDGFLWANGVRFRLGRAQVVAVTQPPTPTAQWLHDLGGRCDGILRRGLPPEHPATDAYAAMFLGRTSEMSDAQRAGFMRTGTMHLFAISGLHINVISLCLLGVLSVARVPARWAALLTLAVLWIFVEATGGSPSARRAFLMVLFMVAGNVLVKPGNLLAALVTSALVVLVWDPLALRSVSFQLSYAVVAALLLYGAPLRNRLFEFWHPWRHLPDADWRWWHKAVFHRGQDLLTLVVVSLTASMVSTPIGIANFGFGSPGAVLINIAVVPVAGIAITAGFASMVCGLAGLGWLSVLFNHAGALAIAAVDVAVQWAVTVPGTFFEGYFSRAWMAPALTLGLLALLAAGYGLGWRRLRGSLWVPPLVTVAMIFLLVTPGTPPEKPAAMKSAYELAMERLRQSDPEGGPQLTAEQKARLGEIDRIYQGKVAEREIFLKQRLAEMAAAGKPDEAEKIRQQLANERERLEEEREAEKNRVRRGRSP